MNRRLALVTVVRVYRPPGFPQSNVELIHFKAPIHKIEGIPPDQIAAMAKAQLANEKDRFFYLGYSPITNLASAKIEPLLIKDEGE